MRNDDKLNVEKLGIKTIVLDRNLLGDHFCEKLSMCLGSDEYLKSICLRKNQIGIAGIKHLASVVSQHSGMICIDLRDNPGYSKRKCEDYLEVMREQFFHNIRVDVEKSKIFGNSRIKIDWMHPECLGLKGNKLDVHDKNKVGPLDR